MMIIEMIMKVKVVYKVKSKSDDDGDDYIIYILHKGLHYFQNNNFNNNNEMLLSLLSVNRGDEHPLAFSDYVVKRYRTLTSQQNEDDFQFY